MHKDIKDKRRIAIIGVRGYPYSYGGYETFVRELVERLVFENIEITVYCHRKLYVGNNSESIESID